MVSARLRFAGLLPLLMLGLLTPTVMAQDVTPTDVKRFLDPTILTSGIRYAFGYTDQPEGSNQAHIMSLDVSPHAQHVFFTDIPVTRSHVTEETQVGVSDLSAGYGFVPYEDLERRLTTVAFTVETSIPTGDENRGLGLGTWVISPAVGVAINVTDLFPIYATYTYRHSTGEIDFPGQTKMVGDDPIRLRTSELDISTVRILPKGFWVLANADWVVNPSIWRLSLGVSGGRAISRSFAWSVSYAQQAGGQKLFDRRWSVALDYLLPWQVAE